MLQKKEKENVPLKERRLKTVALVIPKSEKSELSVITRDTVSTSNTLPIYTHIIQKAAYLSGITDAFEDLGMQPENRPLTNVSEEKTKLTPICYIIEDISPPLSQENVALPPCEMKTLCKQEPLFNTSEDAAVHASVPSSSNSILSSLLRGEASSKL